MRCKTNAAGVAVDCASGAGWGRLGVNNFNVSAVWRVPQARNCKHWLFLLSSVSLMIDGGIGFCMPGVLVVVGSGIHVGIPGVLVLVAGGTGTGVCMPGVLVLVAGGTGVSDCMPGVLVLVDVSRSGCHFRRRFFFWREFS